MHELMIMRCALCVLQELCVRKACAPVAVNAWTTFFLPQCRLGCGLQVSVRYSWNCAAVLHFPWSIEHDQHPTVFITCWQTTGCRVFVCQLLSFLEIFWSSEQKFLAAHRSSQFVEKVLCHIFGATSYYPPSRVLHRVHL